MCAGAGGVEGACGEPAAQSETQYEEGMKLVVPIDASLENGQDGAGGWTDSPGTRIVSVVRMPDGRWAARNERDVSDVTLDDLHEIIEAFKLWAGLLWERRGGSP